MISMVACVAMNGAIGRNGQLLYHLPNDLHKFKILTLNNVVIMGRKTWDSLPKKPLPERRNIVITRQDLQIEGAEVFHSLEDALEATKDEYIVHIIGGGELYSEGIKHADILYITEVSDEPKDADTFFPKIDYNEWRLHSRDKWMWKDDEHEFAYRYLIYKRIVHEMI